MKQDKIVIIDLGNTENSDLARTIRSFGVFSEIVAHDITLDELDEIPGVKGIILNGGVYRNVGGVDVEIDDFVYDFGVPVVSFDYPQSKSLLKWDRVPTEDEVKSFVFDTCNASADWNMKNFVDMEVRRIREVVGNKKVLLALSGGVDSSVVAALLIKAIGRQLYCVHVNHGLMRKNESEGVIKAFGADLGDNLIYIDATDRFLAKLEGISDPEAKRKLIGNEFIKVFDEEAAKLEGIDFLAQGTIYPDIVESGTKTAKTIKSHHNVGGLPEDMEFTLIEPLAQLFKDEVRQAGLELGLSDEMVFRQPFPGPGLGVRVLGSITKDRLHACREADAILREEFKNYGLDKKVWQYFTVIPEFKSVGVSNGNRTYEYPIILRAVNAIDGMSATIEPIDYEVLNKITSRILSEVEHVNRVLYDLSPKPGGTIEWE